MRSGADMRYRAKAYDSIQFNVPKGARELISAKCAENGTNTQALLNNFLREYIGIAPEDWNYKHFADSADDSPDAGRADE